MLKINNIDYTKRINQRKTKKVYYELKLIQNCYDNSCSKNKTNNDSITEKIPSLRELSFEKYIWERRDPECFPKHKLLARQLHVNSEPTLTIHTAGQNFVWTITIREAALDDTLISKMDEADRKIIQWLYTNDCKIENYHYKT